MPFPHAYSVVVVGGERVGKTAIIEQLIFGNHVIGQSCVPTIADIYDIVVETEKGTHERLQIFDTAGSLFTPSGNPSDQDYYLHIADGFILIYEITSKVSFDLVMSVKQKITSRNKDVPIIVLGNKCDCNAIRELKEDVVNIWARSNGIRPYEVTVGSRDSLKDPFCYLAWRIANPGRGSSAMPILAAASGFSNMRSHGGSGTGAPTSREDTEEDDRTGAPPPSDKGEEEDATDHALAISFSSDYPDDALFPNKRSPSNLFLGDCLGVKNKDASEQTQL